MLDFKARNGIPLARGKKCEYWLIIREDRTHLRRKDLDGVFDRIGTYFDTEGCGHIYNARMAANDWEWGNA